MFLNFGEETDSLENELWITNRDYKAAAYIAKQKAGKEVTTSNRFVTKLNRKRNKIPYQLPRWQFDP